MYRLGMTRVRTAWLAALLAAVPVGCGSPEHSTGTSTTTSVAPPGSTAESTASSGGLTIALSASPDRSPIGATVHISARAHEASAVGALAYDVSFGDGTQSSNAVPQFCRQSGIPDTETWQLPHSYEAPGTYVVTASVRVNCGTDQAVTSVTVTVSG